MKLSAAEQKILESVRENTLETQPLLLQGIDLAMAGKKAEALALVQGSIVPRQKKLALHLGELVRLQEHETERAVQDMKDSSANARLLMLLFGGAAILLGLMIAVGTPKDRRSSRAMQAL